MKLLFEACKIILGSGYKAEEWLDENSGKLNINVTTLEEAMTEIRKYI
jgi:hypothetical protein